MLREDFLWGFATAAAQVEGGGEEQELASGKGPSVSFGLALTHNNGVVGMAR